MGIFPFVVLFEPPQGLIYCVWVKGFGVKRSAQPLPKGVILSVFVVRSKHFQQTLVPARSAAVFRRARPLAANAQRINETGFGGENLFYPNRVQPALGEIVLIPEFCACIRCDLTQLYPPLASQPALAKILNRLA